MFDLLALSDAERYSIWAKGIDKEFAYVNYCDEKTKRRFIQLRDVARKADRAQLKNTLASIRKRTQEGEGFKLNMLPADEALEKTDFERFDTELKALMVKAIERGEFIVLGYQHPRKITDSPKPVPIDVWNRPDPWQGNGFNLGATKIVDVHITLKRSVARYFDKQESSAQDMQRHAVAEHTPVKAPKGRPTKEALIHKAFDYGVEVGIIDCSLSNKAIYNQVHNIIKTRWPDQYEGGKGLGDTPMRKYLAERIRANRL